MHYPVLSLIKINEAKIKNEVTNCCEEQTYKYKLFGVFSQKSCVNKEGSRADYFKSIVPRD